MPAENISDGFGSVAPNTSTDATTPSCPLCTYRGGSLLAFSRYSLLSTLACGSWAHLVVDASFLPSCVPDQLCNPEAQQASPTPSTVLPSWLPLQCYLPLMPCPRITHPTDHVASHRYFSGRALVGKMVHAVRELARGISTYVDVWLVLVPSLSAPAPPNILAPAPPVGRMHPCLRPTCSHRCLLILSIAAILTYPILHPAM